MSLSNTIKKLKDTKNYLHEHGQSMGSSESSEKYSSTYSLLQKACDDAVEQHEINNKEFTELRNNIFIGNVCSGSDLKKQLLGYLDYAHKLYKKQTDYIATANKRLQDKNNPENWNDKVNQQVKHKIKLYTNNNNILKNDVNSITPIVKKEIYPQLEYKYRINKNAVRIIPTNVIPVEASDVNNLVSRGIKFMTSVNNQIEKRFANIPKVGGNNPRKATMSENVVYTNSPLVSKSRQQNANVSVQNRNAPIRTNMPNKSQNSGKPKHNIFKKVVNYFSKPYRSNKAANANTNMNPNYNNSVANPHQAYLNQSYRRSMSYATSQRAKQESKEAMAEAISRENTPNSREASQAQFLKHQQARLNLARSKSVSVTNSLSAKSSASSTSASLSTSASISVSASASLSASVSVSNSASIASKNSSKKAKNTNMSANSNKSLVQRLKQHSSEISKITHPNSKSKSSSSSASSEASSASSASSVSSVTGSTLHSAIINNLTKFSSLSEFNSFNAERTIAQKDVKINSYKSNSSSVSVANSNAIATLKMMSSNKVSSVKSSASSAINQSLAMQKASLNGSAVSVQDSLQDSANSKVVSVSTSASNSATANIAKILTNAHTMAVKSAKDVETRMNYKNSQNKSSLAKSFASSASTTIDNNRANDNIDKQKSLNSQSAVFSNSMSQQNSKFSSLQTVNSSLASTAKSYQNQMDRIDALIGK